MSKNKTKKTKEEDTNWLAFNIEMPETLIPLYNFLQAELNRVLGNNEIMSEVKKVDLDLHKGNYWRALNRILKPLFSEWDIGANAWYQRMLYENIRRVLESGKERRTVHDMLVKHGNEMTDEFWKELHASKCFPKHGVVRNVKREIDNGSFTEIPESAVFVMDYSCVSDKAIERKISGNRWLLRTGKTSWLDIEVFLPKNIRKQATGKIAKPRFVKRSSDGKYIGCISYEIKPDTIGDDALRIFGVDLGKVKPFSGSALGADGHVSSEYVISRRTQHLIEKHDRICDELSKLVEKQKRCAGLEQGEKFERREDEIACLRRKKRNLRTEIVRFVALDIVCAALAEDCGEIHVEDLAWLDAKGGRWNHSEVQIALFELAAVYGLRVYRVNAAYSSTGSPFDDELGAECGRDVVFGDGWRIDRDFLSSVNLACRPVDEDGESRNVDVSLKERKPCGACRARRSRRTCLGESGNHESVKLDYSRFFSGGTDVVVFSAGVGGLPPARSVTVTASTEKLASDISIISQEKIT